MMGRESIYITAGASLAHDWETASTLWCCSFSSWRVLYIASTN